jgi:hypothetical protein
MMTKKHFEAMADYIAEMQREAKDHDKKLDGAGISNLHHEAAGAYRLALYLARSFSLSFDRQRFDAWIERKSKAS